MSLFQKFRYIKVFEKSTENFISNRQKNKFKLLADNEKETLALETFPDRSKLNYLGNDSRKYNHTLKNSQGRTQELSEGGARLF